MAAKLLNPHRLHLTANTRSPPLTLAWQQKSKI